MEVQILSFAERHDLVAFSIKVLLNFMLVALFRRLVNLLRLVSLPSIKSICKKLSNNKIILLGWIFSIL